MKVGTKTSQKKSVEPTENSTGRHAIPPAALARCGIDGIARPKSVHDATKAAKAYTHIACTITRRRVGGRKASSRAVLFRKPWSSYAMHALSHGDAVKPKMQYHAWNSHIASSEKKPPRE